VILPDINLLLHAYNSESPVHDRARKWWEELMNGTRSVGLPWVAIMGFVRIATHRLVLRRPLPVIAVCSWARGWLAQPHVSVVHPGDRHAEILFGLLERLGTAGDLTTDGHLAALAIEHQAELHSTDADFARFPGLRWRNPLA
jgi:uncharacterized protein